MIVRYFTTPTTIWPLMLEQPGNQVRPTCTLPIVGWQPSKPSDIVRAGVHTTVEVSYEFTSLSHQIHFASPGFVRGNRMR